MNRTITTAAELDALPVGSVVLDRDGWPMWRTSSEWWYASNGTRGIEWPEIERDGVPLTVLHDPSATSEEAHTITLMPIDVDHEALAAYFEGVTDEMVLRVRRNHGPQVDNA